MEQLAQRLDRAAKTIASGLVAEFAEVGSLSESDLELVETAKAAFNGLVMAKVGEILEKLNEPISPRQEGVLKHHGVDFVKKATPKPYFKAAMDAFDHTGCAHDSWNIDNERVPGCPFAGRPAIAA